MAGGPQAGSGHVRWLFSMELHNRRSMPRGTWRWLSQCWVLTSSALKSSRLLHAMRQTDSVETPCLTAGGWLCAGTLCLSRPRSASDPGGGHPAPSPGSSVTASEQIHPMGDTNNRSEWQGEAGGDTPWGPSLLCLSPGLWQGPHPSMTAAPVAPPLPSQPWAAGGRGGFLLWPSLSRLPGAPCCPRP